MKKRTLPLVVIAIAFTFSLTGCSERQGGSVTADVNQEAIDAFEAEQAKLEREQMEELSDLKL